MNENILLIFTLSAILVASPFLSKFIVLPTTVIEILLGIIASYIGLLNENEFFEIIAEVGFLYLMFLAGLEINLKEIFKIPKEIFKIGFLYIVLLYLLSLLSYFMFNLSAIFILIFPLVSVGVVLTLTKEYPKESRWLKLSLQFGVLGELVSIVALTMSSGLLHYGFSIDFIATMLYLILSFVAMGTFFYVLRVAFWWFPEIKTFLMPHFDIKDQDIRLSFATFFIFISFMLVLDLELVLGAFIAGLFLNFFFEHKKELPHKLSSFGFGFLVPIFFIYIGSTLELDKLLENKIITGSLFVVSIMMAIRVVASMVFIKILKFKDIILFATSQSMPLTLMIAIATLAHQMKSIDTLHYYIFISASVLEVMIALLLIKVISKFTIHRL